MSREEVFTLEAMKCLINREKGIISYFDLAKSAVFLAKKTLEELDKTMSKTTTSKLKEREQ